MTLVVTAACLALLFVPPSMLPPFLYPILPWRWGIVAVLNLVLLLFLGLQMVFGFSLENNFIGAAGTARSPRGAGIANYPGLARRIAVERGLVHQMVSRTIWLDLVVVLQVLAIIGAVLTFLVNRRVQSPLRIDLLT